MPFIFTLVSFFPGLILLELYHLVHNPGEIQLLLMKQLTTNMAVLLLPSQAYGVKAFHFINILFSIRGFQPLNYISGKQVSYDTWSLGIISLRPSIHLLCTLAQFLACYKLLAFLLIVFPPCLILLLALCGRLPSLQSYSHFDDKSSVSSRASNYPDLCPRSQPCSLTCVVTSV